MPTTATRRQRRTMKDTLAAKIPGISWLASLVRRVAQVRVGRAPVGLFALIPVALFLDFVDSPLNLALGPFSMVVAFVLETAFVLGLTGKTGYAIGLSGIDLIPGIDVVPFATITLGIEIAKALRGAPATGNTGDGPVIDVVSRAVPE